MSPSRKPPDFVVLVNSLYIRIGLRDFYFFLSCKVLNYKIRKFRTQGVFEAHQSIKYYAETHGIKIYNATRGGMLEIFERVEFDKLFPR